MKEGPVLARSLSMERFYVVNDVGTKLILVGFDGRIEEGVERFEYQENNLLFEFSATRVDLQAGTVRDFYTVWLGGALKAASHKLPPDTLTIDRAQSIAKNIKEALLVWRYPGKLADILSCHSSAHDAVFIMRQWDKWDPALEGRWP